MFELHRNYCEPQDMQLPMDAFTENPPPKWEKFCSYIFKEKVTSVLKTGVVFQIMHSIMTDDKEPTHIHVMVAQGVHSLTISK